MALTLWKRVLACIERILRVLGETLGVTPQHLMATISGSDKEMSKILVMAEALKKWDEVYGQTTYLFIIQYNSVKDVHGET